MSACLRYPRSESRLMSVANGGAMVSNQHRGPSVLGRRRAGKTSAMLRDLFRALSTFTCRELAMKRRWEGAG